MKNFTFETKRKREKFTEQKTNLSVTSNHT